MKKFLFIILIILLITFTSVIKSSTRSLESQIFNLQEEIIVKKNEPMKTNIPVILATFKSKPYPASQSKCLNSFKT